MKPKVKRVWTREACRVENEGGAHSLHPPTLLSTRPWELPKSFPGRLLFMHIVVSLKFGSVQSMDLLYDHSHPNLSRVSLKFVSYPFNNVSRCDYILVFCCFLALKPVVHSVHIVLG